VVAGEHGASCSTLTFPAATQLARRNSSQHNSDGGDQQQIGNPSPSIGYGNDGGDQGSGQRADEGQVSNAELHA
jgi:hypothetical protein